MTDLEQKHFIGGEWREFSGAEIVSVNPATGESLWQSTAAGSEAVDQATGAARAAYADWRLLDFAARNDYVNRFVEVVRARSEALAEAIHRETGKPLWESRTEIAAMMGKAAISVNAYRQRTGSGESDNNGIHSQLAHRPIGVFAVLGPYNFPGHLPNGHIIPALLAGNTVVFKPSELTPLSGELMIRCWQDAGLPGGVVNMVQGARETGELLVNSTQVDGVLFTGSSATGHAIHQAFAGHPEKMLALEMGGNNPLVVDAVSHRDAALYIIIQSAFISAGQRCTCARRLILLRNDGNRALLRRLREATARIKPGSGDDCFMGPVISNQAADRVQAFARRLLDQGATEIQPLRRPDAGKPFLRPGIIDVTDVADRADEECFGPLLQLIWVDDLPAALAEANNTRYGLAAGLLTDEPEVWRLFRQDIRAGIVNLNRPLTGASGAAPFGGVGASGNYRPGAFYAADYSAYPVASMMSERAELPEKLVPGISL